MKKKSLFLLIVLSLLFTATSIAKPVHLTGEAWVDADPIISNRVLQSVKVTWRFAEIRDMWADNYIAYCADPLREGCDENAPFSVEKKEGNIFTYDIPGEVILRNQSAFNLAHDTDWFNASWLFLPDCKRLHLGRNLIYYKSNPDPTIAKSGGMHLLYVGPGAPFIPQQGDPNLYVCDAVAKVVSTPIAPIQIVPAPAPVVKTVFVPVVTTPIAKKTPAVKKPARKKDCDPCEAIKPVKTDTGEIRKNIGEATDDEKAKNLDTVHKKQTKILKTLGESKKEGENAMDLLREIKAQTEPKTPSPTTPAP